jgi:SAM-dependent methyltransferase
LPENLRDIRRLNRWTGGTALAVKTIVPLLEAPECSLLDVATGSGDIPLAVAADAARRGISLRVTGLDRSGEILREAHRVSGGWLSLVEGDARKLSFPDEAFDVVSLCLALHHFDAEDAVNVLREMWRVARQGLVVVDLRRNALALAGVWVLTRTIARNRLTQHDGPLSVRRAYVPSEVRELALHAGIPDPVVGVHGPARLTLVARKPGHGR